MGLSGRKVKQRIPQDPRNLSWADGGVKLSPYCLFPILSLSYTDASRFGTTYLSKLGFDHADKNATLGVSGMGLTKHLKVRCTPFRPTRRSPRVVQVHHKLDMLGIGAQHTKDPNGIAWKQNQDFENLLRRLNANSEVPVEGEVDSAIIDGFHPAHIDESVVGSTTVRSETKGGDEERKAEKERKSKKKRRQGDDETDQAEKKTKKRKRVELTTVTLASKPAEAGPLSSNSPTPETIVFVATDRFHPKAVPYS